MNSKALFILFSLVVVSLDGVWGQALIAGSVDEKGRALVKAIEDCEKMPESSETEKNAKKACFNRAQIYYGGKTDPCEKLEDELSKALNEFKDKCNGAQVSGKPEDCRSKAQTCKDNANEYASEMWSSSGSGIDALLKTISGEEEEGIKQNCPLYTSKEMFEQKKETAKDTAEQQEKMAGIQSDMTKQKESLSERKHAFENQSVAAADSIESLLNKKIDDVKAIEVEKENAAKKLTLDILRKNEELVAAQKAMQMAEMSKGFYLEALMDKCFKIYDEEKKRVKSDQKARISQNQFYASDFKSLQRLIANNKNEAKQAYKKCKSSAEKEMRIKRAELDLEASKLQMKIATIEGEIATLTQNFNELETKAMEKIEQANRHNDAALATAKTKAEVMYRQMSEAIQLADEANKQLSSQYQMMQAQQLMSGNIMGMTFGNQQSPSKNITATVDDVLKAANELEGIRNSMTTKNCDGDNFKKAGSYLEGAAH